MRIQRSLAALAGMAFAVFLASGGSTPAHAQSKGKSIQTEADWVAYDAEGQTITVKVIKPGSGKEARKLKTGKEAVFHVKAEGSILTRTTVKVNGKAGALTDIPAGKRVNVYWQPDSTKEAGRFARSVDVTFSEEELDERYPDRE